MDELFRKLKRPFNGTWDAVESDIPAFEYIMVRLPVKSITMLKSISKHWCNVLSTKFFILLHYWWSKQAPIFLAFYYKGNLEDNIVHEMHLMEPNGAYSESYTIPVFETIKDLTLIESFNGLICCMSDLTTHEKKFNMALHICNPATREVLALPRGHMSFNIPVFGVLYSDKFHSYKIYKFFSVTSNPNNEYSHCEVYSSETRKWKLLLGVPTRSLMLNPNTSLISNHVCINEKVYWFILEEYEAVIDFTTSILMVDMEDNFREIALPTLAILAFLIEFRGQLCFVEWRGFTLFLWLYNEENDGWKLLDIVKFPVKWNEFDRFDSMVAHEDEILFVYRDYAGLRHELLYDVGRATWKDFRIAEDRKDKSIAVFPFFETLLPCNTHWPGIPQRKVSAVCN